MDLRNVAPHVLILAVPEHFKFAAVGLEYAPILTDPVEGNRRILEEVGQLLLGAATRILLAHTFHAEPELTSDGQGKSDLRIFENMPSVVISHELADEFALDHKGNERKGGDALCCDGRLETLGNVCALDILDANRQRISRIASPWRVPFNCLPIGVGQSTPSYKLHHPGIVKQQYGSALAT